jgi:glycosyltransferase involved in cell wall biosynthesis
MGAIVRRERLVALLRVKDAHEHIARWLAAVSRVADEVVAVDNGSADHTRAALDDSPKVTRVASTEGFDEGRDKNMLLELARERGADWMLWLDVDEIPEAALTRGRVEDMMSTSIWNRYYFKRMHMVTQREFGASPYWLWYSARHDRIMWRDSPRTYFSNQPFNNGLIRGVGGPVWYSHYRIAHYGSADQEALERKIAAYRLIDPSMEETYERIRMTGVRTWKWRERNEAPLLTLGQDVLFDVLSASRAVGRLPHRVLSSFSELSASRRGRGGGAGSRTTLRADDNGDGSA